MQNSIKEKKINICEFFISHQGEGVLVGELMYFIRLGGCNLSCSWCDTDYAKYDFEEHSIYNIKEKLKKDNWGKNRWVCITGGEPLMQKNIRFLIDLLLEEKYKIILETNGSYPVNDFKKIMISMDIKCPSSGETENNILSNISYLTEKDQLKFVIDTNNDYIYANYIINKYKPKCVCVFQPVSKNFDNSTTFKWLFEKSTKDLLNVRVILQQHKIIFGEVRGV